MKNFQQISEQEAWLNIAANQIIKQQKLEVIKTEQRQMIAL